jgi:hypothetical protein
MDPNFLDQINAQQRLAAQLLATFKPMSQEEFNDMQVSDEYEPIS